MNAQELILWNESENQIDTRIASFLSEKGWDTLLPNGLDNQDRMKAFYSHIMYVINSFLEEEDTRELYIQIPVEELANKDSNARDDKQIKRFRWLNGTIAACLQMATVEQLRKNVFVPDDIDYDNTLNWYKKGDFFLVNKKNGGCFFAEVVSIENSSRLKFYDSLKYYSQNKGVQGSPRQAFNECDSSSFVRIKSFPSQVKKGVNQIYEMVEIVKNTTPISLQYNSAALVSIGAYSPLNEHLVTNCQYLNTTVKFFSDYHQATDCDVIIVCGDKQYNKVAQAYRNSNARKIIYMGSVPPFERNIKTYPFSFREIYRYCSSRFQFKEPDIITLPFPWLEERKKELRSLLLECCQEDEFFTEEDVINVERKLLCYFSRYDFDTIQLERVKSEFNVNNIEEKLNLDIDVSDDTIELIANWIRSLSFDATNPKLEWLKRNDRLVKSSLIIGKSYRNKNYSYKQKVKQLCGYDNTIILDNLAINNFWDDRYPTILRYHLFANITALYYTNESYAFKSLLNYISQEFKCYTDEFRKKLFTNVEIEIPQPELEALPDWWDDFVEEEYLINESISGQTERCSVTFEDGTSDTIDGDVIADLGEEGYVIINVREAKKGMDISYYKRDIENFERLISACTKYQVQWNLIINSSKKWKQKLLDVYNTKIDQGLSREDAIRTISVDSALPTERVKAYCKDNSPRFLNSRKEMINILNYLVSLRLITEEDKKTIASAKRLNGQAPIKFGRELKKVLYDSFLNDNFNSSFLEGISKNCGLSINDIFSSAIVSNKIIRTIKILNTND